MLQGILKSSVEYFKFPKESMTLIPVGHPKDELEAVHSFNMKLHSMR